MLTEKPHCDGSPLSRCQLDDARMSPAGDPIEVKAIMSDLSSCSSNKSSLGTPIKMLIAYEMSKEMDSKLNSTSLVAKLMGLDPLPKQESHSVPLQKDHSQYYHNSGIPLNYWQQNDEIEMQKPRELHYCSEQGEYKDVYEVFNKSQQGNYTRNISPQKGRDNENQIEKKMAFVREKFIEAKRLATNENLPQSKRFQDALEVLTTNRDLFVKFLQEPNSLISQNQFNFSSAAPPDTKRITVLKPSKMVEGNKLFGSQKNEKQKNRASDTAQKMGWDKSSFGVTPPNWRFIDDPTQPTRIVVLKPSSNKLQDIKAVVSPPPLSPRVLHHDEFPEELEENDTEKSIEINQHRRDDSLLSSVFSNGYIGDESSFHKSENGYLHGNLSDSDAVSPISRHSWDYIHRVGTPFSSSSFGYASCSPESSVCREAKKRLSERWTMVTNNGIFVEQPKHVRRSSSTLGEMLSLPDIKNSVLFDEGTSREQEARGSTSCLPTDLNRDQNVDNSYMNLLRSKSVPISSSMLEETLNLQASNLDSGKTNTPNEMEKPRSLKTSLKGKVSSFFSRSRKSGKGKASASLSSEESDKYCESTSYSGKRCANGTIKEDGFPHSLQASSKKASLPDSNGMEAKHRIIFPEAGLSVAKPMWLGNPKDNQDQPSPISVLEQLFEEDDNLTSLPSNAKFYDNGPSLISQSLRSNLIDKSPPIGSISRTLSRDNSCIDRRSDYAFSPSPVPCRTPEGEQEWHFYVKFLLSAAGLSSEDQPDSFTARWHSPDSPLDPSLRDQHIDLNEKETTHEGKRRRIRSTRKLVFDCVNSVLGELTCNDSKDGDGGVILESEMVDRVWARMREWFSVEVRCDDEVGNSLVVRKEVVGKSWVEYMKEEMDNIGKEIEENLLEELVHEAVVELTGRL